jgi:hypothetical protein
MPPRQVKVDVSDWHICSKHLIESIVVKGLSQRLKHVVTFKIHQTTYKGLQAFIAEGRAEKSMF